jgi:predicted RNA-binding Zn ribbon-like protein
MPPSPAVPEHIRLILDAANTFDVEERRDAWQTPAELAQWLRTRTNASATREITGREHASAVAFRDALRQLIAEGCGVDLDNASVDFDRAAAPFAVRLGRRQGRPNLEPVDDGPLGGVADIVAAVAQSGAEGAWDRVKLCPGDACLVAFYDESRNRSRTWCSMAVCGNRTKTRVYRTHHQPT